MGKTKEDRSYFIWSVIILLCVILAGFSLIFASCARSEGGREPNPGGNPQVQGPQTPDPQTPEDDTIPPDVGGEQSNSVELGETGDMGQEYIDKIVFLGDSTTNGLAAYEIVNRNQVWTPTNGTLTISRWDTDKIYYPDGDTQLFITDAVSLRKPEYMLLTLGVNGVSFLNEEDFTLCYESLIDAIKQASPDTKIILNSIYPVSVNYDKPGINNQNISAANQWIRQIAENKDVKFLNSASIMLDENGAMIESYHNGDFIHPNPDAYRLIIDYIRTHGWV